MASFGLFVAVQDDAPMTRYRSTKVTNDLISWSQNFGRIRTFFLYDWQLFCSTNLKKQRIHDGGAGTRPLFLRISPIPHSHRLSRQIQFDSRRASHYSRIPGTPPQAPHALSSRFSEGFTLLGNDPPCQLLCLHSPRRHRPACFTTW